MNKHRSPRDVSLDHDKLLVCPRCGHVSWYSANARRCSNERCKSWYLHHVPRSRIGAWQLARMVSDAPRYDVVRGGIR